MLKCTLDKTFRGEKIMMNRKMVKIICIVMAALMLLSVGAVVLQVFALGEKEIVASIVTPETGDGLSDYVIPVVIAVVAVLGVVVSVVLPKLKKKD